jgi:hypothetical protein
LYSYQDYILESHPSAAGAASVAACAKQQGKFKEVLEALFFNPELLNDGQFEIYQAISSHGAGYA